MHVCMYSNLNVTMTLDMIYVIHYNAVHVLEKKNITESSQLDKSFCNFSFFVIKYRLYFWITKIISEQMQIISNCCFGTMTNRETNW